jgi:GNAT superfamily N-acetyltransferase
VTPSAAPPRADRDALAALVVACERTYLEWAPAGWTVPEVAPAWLRRVPEPGVWLLCAPDGAGAIAGFVCFRPAHIVALYVHPSAWRQGIATGLLARAEDALRAQGYRAASLWTPDGAPAERFYVARGWRRDGRSRWDGWLGLQMVGYAKRL